MAWEYKEDYLTPAIKADFWSEGFYERHDRARELVRNRPSKGALVYLVAYLLKERDE